MHPLDYFDRIYVINLASRTDRRREMDHQLKLIGLGLEFPKIELFTAMCPADKGEFETIGTRGCFLSHLGVLKAAAAAGYDRILILEDDANFAPRFVDRCSRSVASLASQDWSIFYGGHRVNGVKLSEGILPVSPELNVLCCHFLAFRGAAIRTAADFLETLLSRRGGDLLGGPMHVDGAFSWLRRTHPEFMTLLALPELAYQRASRTDIHELRWFDRVPVVRQVASLVRILRNRIHSARADLENATLSGARSRTVQG